MVGITHTIYEIHSKDTTNKHVQWVFFLSIYSSHNNSKYTYVKQCNFNKINVFLNKMCDILKLHYQPYERTRIVCVCCIHLWLLVVNYNVHGKLTPFALYMTSLGFTFGTQICFEWDINTREACPNVERVLGFKQFFITQNSTPVY